MTAAITSAAARAPLAARADMPPPPEPAVPPGQSLTDPAAPEPASPEPASPRPTSPRPTSPRPTSPASNGRDSAAPAANGAAAPDDTDRIGRPIGLIMADFPTRPDPFIAAEIRGLQTLGHRVVPIAVAPDTREGGPGTEPLAAVARHLADASDLQALAILAMGAGNVPAAIRFCRHQGVLPWRSLLWRGARLAALADNADIEHLHARGSGEIAALAIVAALLLGRTASLRVATPDELAMLAAMPNGLAAASFVVAADAGLAAAAQAMAPGLRTVVLTPVVDLHEFQLTAISAHPADRRMLVLGPAPEAAAIAALLAAIAAQPEGRRPSLAFACDGLDAAAVTADAERLGIAGQVRCDAAPAPGEVAERIRGCTTMIAPLGVGDADSAAGAAMLAPVWIKAGLAAGVPIIATGAATPSVATDLGCARAVAPGDAAALANAVAEMARMPAGEVAAFGHGARRRATQLLSARAQMRPLSAMIEKAGPDSAATGA